MRKPQRLRPGDAVALVAPASAFKRDEFEAGLAELRALGFAPRYDPSVFARDLFSAGSPQLRAQAFMHAWNDPDVRAIIAVRGGYGSAQLLPLLRAEDFSGPPKAFVAYSDNTSLLSWLTVKCGIVTFHGAMVEGRLAGGPDRYDRDSFLLSLTRAEPMGAVGGPAVEVLRHGEASGRLVGGTMTQLAASLGTPYAFDPPEGCVLFLDEIGERPFRVHRLFTQLQQAGIIARAGALVFNELPRCTEACGTPTGRDAVMDLIANFAGPVLFGLPSGHTDGATLTLPFGVTARVSTEEGPRLFIEEAAVI